MCCRWTRLVIEINCRSNEKGRFKVGLKIVNDAIVFSFVMAIETYSEFNRRTERSILRGMWDDRFFYQNVICLALVLSDYTSYCCSSLAAILEVLWTKRGWGVQNTDRDVPLSTLLATSLWPFNVPGDSSSGFAQYNWPHCWSCAARYLKRQISCHNKHYIQLSQSQPCTGKVQKRHEYWNLYVTMLWSYRVVESSGCKHGGKQCSLLRQKRQNSSKISMDRLIKVDEKTSVSNIIHISYI